MKRIVLASASPRRRALLEALGMRVDVMPSDADETFDGRPEEMVVINAKRKRDEVAGRLQDGALVIAADTLVFLDGTPLGKPSDLDEAHGMLRRLSGNTHEVITGIAAIDRETGAAVDGFEVTRVTFRDLSQREIGAFVDAVQPLDRAGAYTVDGPGSLLVAGYAGCYQNVLGLPMVRLQALLSSLGFDLFEQIDKERATFL